jgi:hypothetical protein
MNRFMHTISESIQSMRGEPMLDLLAGMQMARRATEGQFREDDRERRPKHARTRRSLVRVPSLLRLSPSTDRERRPASVVGRPDGC